jgi:hypothetical protein
MPNSQQAAFYNEGMGHGAFIAQCTFSGLVVLADFSIETPARVIEQTNQIGAPLKQAAVTGFVTWTATAQTPVTEGTNPVTNPVIIQQGEAFVEPFRGRTCWVAQIGEVYRAGEFWMQNISGRITLSGQ